MLKTYLQRLGLALWAVLTPLLGGTLLMLHESPLPVRTPLQGTPAPRWSVLHLLAARCPCSARVLISLLNRGARPDVAEKIVLVEGTLEQARAIAERGFAVDCPGSEELEPRYGQSGAPLLVVHDLQGRAVYAGAYSPRPEWPSQDGEILNRLLAGQAVNPLRPQGCAVSRSLQKRLDPLGLKYGNGRP